MNKPHFIPHPAEALVLARTPAALCVSPEGERALLGHRRGAISVISMISSLEIGSR
jgi:hypothetical protein